MSFMEGLASLGFIALLGAIGNTARIKANQKAGWEAMEERDAE